MSMFDDNKDVINYVVSFEDGKFFVMKLYADRQWDTVHTYDNPADAINLMLRMKTAMDKGCCQNPGWCSMPHDYCAPPYWRLE